MGCLQATSPSGPPGGALGGETGSQLDHHRPAVEECEVRTWAAASREQTCYDHQPSQPSASANTWLRLGWWPGPSGQRVQRVYDEVTEGVSPQKADESQEGEGTQGSVGGRLVRLAQLE